MGTRITRLRNRVIEAISKEGGLGNVKQIDPVRVCARLIDRIQEEQDNESRNDNVRKM